MFFVISGFVVGRSFLKDLPSLDGTIPERIGKASPLIRDFYIRRAFRILPLAVSWIVLYFLIGQLINFGGGYYGELRRWAKEIAWFVSGFFNYFIAYSHGPGLFGHYWSLSVEMHFYFVLPFLLVIIPSKRGRIILCAFGILLVAMVLRPLTKDQIAVGLVTHSQFDALLFGVLLYLLFGKEKGAEFSVKREAKYKNTFGDQTLHYDSAISSPVDLAI